MLRVARGINIANTRRTMYLRPYVTRGFMDSTTAYVAGLGENVQDSTIHSAIGLMKRTQEKVHAEGLTGVAISVGVNIGPASVTISINSIE